MGHNGECAFTLTIFGSDQEDIYVYDLNPNNPHQYRYLNQWETMEVVEEEFEIRGYPKETHVLHYTRHGPVLLLQAQEQRAYALRSVWWEAGTCAYLAGVSTMRSRNLDEFKNSITRFGAPALNHIYADTSGTIAWLPYGFSPIRPNWDGLTPVSGNGEYEWQGFVPQSAMPAIINPECGYVASANEMNLPSEWLQVQKPVGFEWLEKSRACRIKQVLDQASTHAVEDSCRLQTDIYSWPGLRLQQLLLKSSLMQDQELNSIMTRFTGWDCQLNVESPEAIVQEWWLHKEIKPALFKLFVKEPEYLSLMYPGDIEGILTALEKPSAIFGEQPEISRDELLKSTLLRTLGTLAEKFGPDMESWRWGNLHHAYFEHALSRTSGSDWVKQADVGPAPKPGSASTVMHAAYRESDFRVTYGASVRLVMDIGDWDNSRCMNTPGQSGDLRSSYYSNLFNHWAQGEYVPMLYSDAAVNDAVTQRIIIRPIVSSS